MQRKCEGSVVDLHKPRDGENSFVMCGCTEEGTPMIPLAIMSDAPFIAELPCLECQAEVPVNSGYIGE